MFHCAKENFITDSALKEKSTQVITNKELRFELVRRMKEYVQAHPEVKTISLIPSDGFGWCECSECAKFYDKERKGDFYSLSAHVYKADKIYHDLVGDMTAKLHEQVPDINMSFCAYVNYCAPSENFELNSGMAVHVALYWRCINHALDDENCPVNRHYAQDIVRWCAVKNGGKRAASGSSGCAAG